MSTELGIYLHGPKAGTEAKASLAAAQHLLDLVGELERLTRPTSTSGPSTWGFTHLSVGSLDMALKPLELRGQSTEEDLETALARLVDGFLVAEHEAVVPDGWSLKAAEIAIKASAALGASEDFGMRLTVRGGTEAPERRADVSARASRHLREATRVHYRAVGSVRGHIGNMSDRPETKALLWDDVTNRRISVRFKEEHREKIRAAWGRDHVEVYGVIEENAYGQALKIAMEDLEILDTEEIPSREDIRGGFYPELTGGLSVEEHLAVIRGEA